MHPPVNSLKQTPLCYRPPNLPNVSCLMSETWNVPPLNKTLAETTDSYLPLERNMSKFGLSIQPNAVITRSNIKLYCIQHWSYWSRIEIRLCIHKRHPIGVFSEDFAENSSRYNGTALYHGCWWLNNQQHGMRLMTTNIPTWIRNHILSKVWDEITYPFPNINGATVEVLEWIGNFIPHFTMDIITHHAGIKVNPHQ